MSSHSISIALSFSSVVISPRLSVIDYFLSYWFEANAANEQNAEGEFCSMRLYMPSAGVYVRGDLSVCKPASISTVRRTHRHESPI